MPGRFVSLAYLLILITVPAVILSFRYCPDTGLTSLLRFGSFWEDLRSEEIKTVPRHILPNHNGYDGQFYAEIAVGLPELNVAELQTTCDLGSYRARRILMPCIAALLGGGDPARILNAFAAINLAAWLSLALIAWHLLPPVSWTNAARFTALLLAAGTLESIRASLPDLPALTLILAAVLLNRHGRPWAATALLALAGLCKETSVLAVALFLPPAGSPPKAWFIAAAQAAAAVVPAALCWLFLRAHFGPSHEGANNFNWPFLGWFEISRIALDHLGDGNTDRGRWVFFWLASLSVAVQLAFFWAILPRTHTLWRAAFGFAVLLPFLAVPVWSGYWAVLRNILPLTAACILLLPTTRWSIPALAAISLPSLHALFRLAY